MGLCASQARLLMLTARKSDLELRLQFINQARMSLANMMSALFPVNGNLDPNNPAMQQKIAAMTVVQQQDKMLEMQAKQVDMQHQAVQTEVEAVQKVIQKNIESSFKLMG
jgi:chaperonin cofactor prefoldin